MISWRCGPELVGRVYEADLQFRRKRRFNNYKVDLRRYTDQLRKDGSTECNKDTTMRVIVVMVNDNVERKNFVRIKMTQRDFERTRHYERFSF